jgi:hypothetical protein
MGVHHLRSETRNEVTQRTVFCKVVPSAHGNDSYRDAKVFESVDEGMVRCVMGLENRCDVDARIPLSSGEHGDDALEPAFPHRRKDMQNERRPLRADCVSHRLVHVRAELFVVDQSAHPRVETEASAGRGPVNKRRMARHSPNRVPMARSFEIVSG